MTLKNDEKFEEELTCCFKMYMRNLTNLTQVPKSLNNSHFNGLLLTKVYNVWVKKVQSSYLSWHWRVMQNLKKNWLVAWKKTWGIWQIFIRALKSLKIGTLMGSFYPKQKTYELKIYRWVMKNDEQFEEESTCRFKIGVRDLTNFDPST